MKFDHIKKLGVGLLAAVFAAVLIPFSIQAQVPEEQMDGVMGQSIEEENIEFSSELWAAAAATDTQPMYQVSFATSALFDSGWNTYYHKPDYKNYSLMNGIDVSWHQSKGDKKTTALDWEKIHDAGIDFAFVRAASRDTKDGSLYEDTCAGSHIQEAVKNKVDVGLYVFSQALTEEEAREEAEYLLNLVDQYGWNPTMPLVIDREKGSYNRLTAGKLSKAKETAVCQAFADTIVEAGYEPVVYAAYSWINSYLDTSRLKNCGIWIARYNRTTTSNGYGSSSKLDLTPYADVAYDYNLWQYSSSGKVDGYSGKLDVNFWYKDTRAKTTGLAATKQTTDSVKLTWNAAGDAPRYRVYRYDEDQDKYIYLGSTSKRSYTDNDLESGKTFLYRVRGYWTIGGKNYYGTYSDVIETTTLPGKVEGVAADTHTDASVTFSWDPQNNASGYRIYQYDESQKAYTRISDVENEQTQFTVEGLSPADTYRFKVKAYKKLGGVTYWGEASSAFVAYTNPGQVISAEAKTLSSESLELSWGMVQGAEGYRIYRYDSGKKKYVRIAVFMGNEDLCYTDTGLASGTRYSYKIRAYYFMDGYYYPGECCAAVKGTTKPAKVTGLVLSTKSSSVSLKWEPVEGAAGYQIYRLDDKTKKYVKVGTCEGKMKTAYQDKKLKKGSSYTYKVRAYRLDNEIYYYGSFSGKAKIKVK